MTLLRERDTFSPIRSKETPIKPKVYLGSYMPFAGVKVYALLDENDIASGRDRIGPVGWRVPKQSIGYEARVPEADLVLV